MLRTWLGKTQSISKPSSPNECAILQGRRGKTQDPELDDIISAWDGNRSWRAQGVQRGSGLWESCALLLLCMCVHVGRVCCASRTPTKKRRHRVASASLQRTRQHPRAPRTSKHAFPVPCIHRTLDSCVPPGTGFGAVQDRFICIHSKPRLTVLRATVK